MVKIVPVRRGTRRRFIAPFVALAAAALTFAALTFASGTASAEDFGPDLQTRNFATDDRLQELIVEATTSFQEQLPRYNEIRQQVYDKVVR